MKSRHVFFLMLVIQVKGDFAIFESSLSSSTRFTPLIFSLHSRCTLVNNRSQLEKNDKDIGICISFEHIIEVLTSSHWKSIAFQAIQSLKVANVWSPPVGEIASAPITSTVTRGAESRCNFFRRQKKPRFPCIYIYTCICIWGCVLLLVQPWHTSSGFKRNINNQISHDKKPSYFPLYWLFNRSPYNGLQSPHNRVI